jgi:hypothetical protein
MKGITIAILVAVACAGLGILTLGLPGAIVFEAFGPLLRAIFGPDALERLPPDSAWPIAILIALLWPVGIVAGYLVGFRLLKNTSVAGQIGGFAAALVVWCGLLSVVCYLMGQRAG